MGIDNLVQRSLEAGRTRGARLKRTRKKLGTPTDLKGALEFGRELRKPIEDPSTAPAARTPAPAAPTTPIEEEEDTTRPRPAGRRSVFGGTNRRRRRLNRAGNDTRLLGR